MSDFFLRPFPSFLRNGVCSRDALGGEGGGGRGGGGGGVNGRGW